MSAENKPLRAFTGVLLKQGKNYLLQHRDDDPSIHQPGRYSIWGGLLEDGEKPIDGAVRELEEETGLVVNKKDLIHVVYAEYDRGDAMAKGTVYFYEVPEDVEVKCFEGQGIYKTDSLESIPYDKNSTILPIVASVLRERA